MTLDRRALNRACLARQLLMGRAEFSIPDAIEALIGLQGQAPFPPYTGLWTRLADFDPAELGALITAGAVVRTALMRGTVHLVTAGDALAIRPLVQPVLDSWIDTAIARRLSGVALDDVAQRAAEVLADRPRPPAELAAELARTWPDADPEDLGRVARGKLALVQLPPRAVWGRTGRTVVATADRWLSGVERPALTIDGLVRRYLAAFGPATVADIQKWCGLARLREVVDRQPDIVRLTGDEGAALFDLPDLPRPAGDEEVGVRFLPEFDNVLLSYADGSRILDPAYRPAVFTANGIIRACLLVDGFVAATWKIVRTKHRAVLEVTELQRVPASARLEIEREGAGLLAFDSPDREHDIRFVARLS